MSLILKKRSFAGGLIPGVILLLSGCVTPPPDESERLAARQAEQIRTRLPVQSGGYTWVLAGSTGAVITMTVIGDSPLPSPDARRNFVQQFRQRLCASPAVRLLLTKQVAYRIVIKEMGQTSATETVVDQMACQPPS